MLQDVLDLRWVKHKRTYTLTLYVQNLNLLLGEL